MPTKKTEEEKVEKSPKKSTKKTTSSKKSTTKKTTEKKVAKKPSAKKVAVKKTTKKTAEDKVTEKKTLKKELVEEITNESPKSTSKKSKKTDDFDWNEFEEGIQTIDAKQIEEFDKLIDDNFVDTYNDNVIVGEVVNITEREAIIDINAKSEGVISLNEFRYNPDLKIGDKVEVIVDIQEDKTGQLVLSHRKARTIKAWERVIDAHQKETVVTGFVKCRTKGGMIVDVFGLEAFLPGSQIDVKPIRDYDQFVNKNMEFRIVKINHEFKNVVVSHKALIEADIEEQKKEKQSLLNEELAESDKLQNLRVQQRRIVQDLEKEEKRLRAELRKQRRSEKELTDRIDAIIEAERRSALLNSADMSAISEAFAEEKGRLSWPVDDGFISSKYGKHKHPTLKRVTIDNKGVDIQTAKDAYVKSVFNGKVVGVMSIQGQGITVLVQHGDFFTAYSKLKAVTVKKDETIVEGQAIGQVITGSDNVSEMKFRINTNKGTENPENWLQSKIN